MTHAETKAEGQKQISARIIVGIVWVLEALVVGAQFIGL